MKGMKPGLGCWGPVPLQLWVSVPPFSSCGPGSPSLSLPLASFPSGGSKGAARSLAEKGGRGRPRWGQGYKLQAVSWESSGRLPSWVRRPG